MPRFFRAAATLCLVWLASTSAAPLPDAPLARLKTMQQRIHMQEPAEKAERLEKFQEWHKRSAKHGTPRRRAGVKLRGEQRVDLTRARPLDYFAKVKPRALSALTAPSNRLVNDTVGEPDGSCQSEVSIASFGNYVVAAWNDGIGIYDIPQTDTQGFAYSTDAGVTWTDGGIPPKANIGQWSSDPVVVVNEKTGAFYYCGLTDQVSAGTNGIGVVKGTFTGNTFNWGTPVLATAFSNFVSLLDKQWMAVDSLSGNLYITYSHFSISGGVLISDEIRFLRSTNDGQNWTSPTRISDPNDDGYVQGSRVAVGPAGELYTVWHSIGRQDNSPYGRDFLRVRRSTDQGASFNPEATAESLFSNFPSGAPGFNRPIGITFPAIAVDRSNGPNRGRVYLTWNESLNFYADADRLPNPQLGDPGINETENNNAASVADGFTPGLILRGSVAPTNDLDYWSWPATQGITYFFWLDSMGVNLDASFRVFCSDGVTNLAFNQNGEGVANGGELLVFTAPTSATYYLRVASYQQGRTGVYRIRTVTHVPRGDDRARDHRDIFIKSSTNGFTWGPTVRVNDSPGNFDDFLPEVVVDGGGRVFVADYDWRDAPNCGGASNVYLYRSDNAGSNWVGGSRISDYTTDWSNVTFSTLIPNQGDYIGLFARDSTVFVSWSDGRNVDITNSNPDVYMASTTLNCTAAPIAGGGIVLTADRDSATVKWLAADGTTATLFRRVGAGPFVDLGPLTADVFGEIVYEDGPLGPGTYTYRLGVTGFCEQYVGQQSVTISGPSAPLLAINDVRPNPTPGDVRVSFTLASWQKATLALYDISGRLIGTLDVSDRGPGGPHSALLYSGNLRAGIYFVQLAQGGSTKEKRISVFP